MADPPAASPMSAMGPTYGPKDPSPRMFQGKRESRNPNEDEAESLISAFNSEEFLPDDLNSLLKASGAAIEEEKRKNERNRARKTFSISFDSSDSCAELSADIYAREAIPDQSKPSPFSRKAQRFSSLKKKKLSSTLMNRIFCNTGSEISQKGSDHDDEVFDKVCLVDEVNRSNGNDENRVPPEVSNKADSDPYTSTCGGGFAGVVENARDTLTLYAEDEVREAIQSSFNEVMGMTCKSKNSPPSSKSHDEKEEKNDGLDYSETDHAKNASTSGDSVFERFIACASTPPRNATTPNIPKSHDEKEEKNDGLGCSDVDHAKNISTSGDSVFERFVACASSPPRNSITPNKPAFTPGKLVIPALFANSESKSLFPASIEKVFFRSPVKNIENIPKKPTKIDFSSKNSNRSKQISLVGTESDDEADENLSTGSSSSSKGNSMSPPPIEMVIAASPRHQATQSNPVPPPALVRIVPSCEELSTVNEVSTNGSSSIEELKQERIIHIDDGDDDDAAFLPDDFEAFDRQGSHDLRKITSEELDQHINEALAKAEIEWNDPFGKESRSQIEYAVENALKAAHRQFQLQDDEVLCRHQQELADLKSKYKTKLAEQKDQLASANRLAHARQLAIERLENNGEITKRGKELTMLQNELKLLRSEKENIVEKFSSQANQLREELSKTRSHLERTENKLNTLEHMPKEEADSLREKCAKLETTREELRLEKERVKEIEQRFSAESNAHSRVQKELETALADKEALQAQQAVIPAELLRVQKELKTVKAKLAKYEMAYDDSQALSEELASVSKELEETKARQSEVEKELEESSVSVKNLQEKLNATLRDQESKAHENELMKTTPTKTPARRDSTDNLPNPRLYRPNTTPRTPVKSPNRPGTTSTTGTPSKKSPSLRNHSDDLHEKEKESLRQQVAFLEEQIKKRNEEHQRSLKELRTANEGEMVRIKKEYEYRVEEKAEKERELKENHSAVEGREREILLEKIESLEADKKADRNGGLREVQNKEDLLQRVTALERKEKDLTEEYEKVIRDMRVKYDADIQQLCASMEEQSHKSRATENELRGTISETSSYDKEELLERVDKLQSQLESERSSSLLVNLKVTNAEKEAVLAFKQHQSEITKLKEDIKVETAKFEKEHDAKLKMESNLKELLNDLNRTQKDLKSSKEKFAKELTAQKAASETRFKEIQDGHTKELDDLLTQLDLVEAEHKQSIEAKEQLIWEKESYLETLRLKLDDMELKAKAHQKIEKTWTLQLEHSEKTARTFEQALVVLQDEYNQFEKAHDKYVVEAEEMKEKACKSAENKMIERAEKQFKQANDLYVKLKKQYDLVRNNAERLEGELKETKNSHASINKETEDRLNELGNELAKLKVAKDLMEKEAAQKAKDYRKEMQGLLQAAEEFETKYEEAAATSSSLEQALSQLESQKSKLKSEYDELHKVCDELMAHMEAQDKARQHEF